MNVALKALGALLMYPDEVLLKAVQDMRTILESSDSIPAETMPELRRLLDYLETTDAWTVQEQYVERFDMGRSTSLHIFEHIHGESKDRGQAMVDLRDRYEQAGLTLAGQELPDYIPVFLEFLSLQEWPVVQEYLGDCSHVLEALRQRLEEKNSPYAAIFRILESWAIGANKNAAIEVQPETPLDEQWEEEPAFSSCSLPDRSYKTGVV